MKNGGSTDFSLYILHVASGRNQVVTIHSTPSFICTDRFSIPEYKVCEPLYDTLVHSYSNHYEITSEAPFPLDGSDSLRSLDFVLRF